MSAGVAEYMLESRLCPQLKQQEWVAYLGLLLVLLGESIRKLAMVSCVDTATSIGLVASRLSALSVRLAAPGQPLPVRPAAAAPQVTAASAFTHDIQHTKRPEHQLVTSGIYRCALVYQPGQQHTPCTCAL
jgi:hypothetical protein